MAERIILGSAKVCLASRELFVGGEKAHLPWRTFEVLRVLIEARGEVVAKDEILRRVWGNGFVDDSNLTQAISQIRKAVDPPPEGKSYIETVPRIGYRLPMPKFVDSPAPVFVSPASNRQDQAGTIVKRQPPNGSQMPAAFRRFQSPVLIVPLAISLAILLGAGFAFYRVGTQGQRESRGRFANPSVAVLPLENRPADPLQEYFSNGVTDALIARLAKIRALRVVSRSSVLPRKESNKAVPEIARELGVDYIVKGTVERFGNRIRITAQLVAGPTERTVWAESYERDLNDILAVQGDVARAIARQIGVQLTPQDQARLATVRPIDRQAYEAYLKGRYYQAKRTEEGLKKSIEYFQEAVSKNPGYSQAYSGLADSHTYLLNQGLVPPRAAALQAKAMAAKAIEIDESLAEAHTSLAYIKLVYDWDWPGAEKEFRRSINLDPTYSKAHSLFACYFALQRRFDEALAEVRQALLLDPLSSYDNANLGWHLHMARRYDEAMEQYRRAIDMDPASAKAHNGFGLVLEQKKMYAQAITEFQRAVALDADASTNLASLAHVYALAANRSEADRVLKQLRALSNHKYVSAYDMAIVHTSLGNRSEALNWLEKGYQERDGWLWLRLNLDPRLDPLQSEPRFNVLLARMRLPH